MENKETLKNKIDFVMLVTVKNANPNGDPLSGNRPRENFEGCGEISDVCIKRKIRNRLQDMGEKVFVQSDERCEDGYRSLSERFGELKNELKSTKEDKKQKIDTEELEKTACEKWIDVRSFGQVFAFKDESVSIGVRGPVSLHEAISVSPIEVVSLQITKSVNGDPSKDGGKSSDTMGMKHFVRFGMYKIKGSINCQLAEKTGFTYEDAQKIKKALETLFENDSSAARPEGSMEVYRLYWWEHKDKMPKTNTATVHKSIEIVCKEGVEVPQSADDYIITLNNPLDCVTPEIFQG